MFSRDIVQIGGPTAGLNGTAEWCPCVREGQYCPGIRD